MEVKKKYLKVETRSDEDKSNVQSSSLQDNLKAFWISITEDEEHIKQIEKSFTNTIKSKGKVTHNSLIIRIFAHKFRIV